MDFQMLKKSLKVAEKEKRKKKDSFLCTAFGWFQQEMFGQIILKVTFFSF